MERSIGSMQQAIVKIVDPETCTAGDQVTKEG